MEFLSSINLVDFISICMALVLFVAAINWLYQCLFYIEEQAQGSYTVEEYINDNKDS